MSRSAAGMASEVKIRVRVVHGAADAFGPGKAQLLESLLQTGSLNRSAAALGMSYMKALALVRAMNEAFAEPLVVMTRGGRNGGGAQVTATGERVLAEYGAMRKASEAASRPAWKRLARLLKS